METQLVKPPVIVLVGTSHPGNIGASARAMKAMGLGELRLVAPLAFPHSEATARAVDAADLLESCRIYVDLAAAIADIDLVIGTSARMRHLDWPQLSPRAAASLLVERDAQSAAVVFGSEQSGLSNRELDLCQYLITVPTSPEFSSLNLAQAVQICAYEIFLARGDIARSPTAARAGERHAPAREIELLRQHCLTVMQRIGFYKPAQPKLLERRLRRMLARAQLLASEVQVLRGFLAAVEAELDQASRPR
jgi:TrmH family RNA methyltransferase